MNDVPRESVKTWNIFQLGRAKQELLLRDGSFFFERGGGGEGKLSGFLRRNSCSTTIAEKKNRKMEAMGKKSSKVFAMLKTNYCTPRKMKCENNISCPRKLPRLPTPTP